MLAERIDGKWIYFWRTPKEDKPKTQVWHIYTKETNDHLGDISWFSLWRKYAFRSICPQPPKDVYWRFLSDVWFEEDCLEEIARFCRELTRKHREKVKEEKG